MVRSLFLIALLFAGPVFAEGDVFITHDMPSAIVETENGPVEISRIQDTENELWGEWSRTSRPCPPFCIQPIQAVEGTNLIGELEMIEALQDPETVVIDSRVRSNYQAGTIPGALNVPYTEITDYLETLGCVPDFEGYDCDQAKPVALFCNGPWCGQSPSAARFMIAAGYPAELISLYRGGMQVWRMLGLTVILPE
ncbi:MAG: rhodanese-like domain-containing protein [Paracoccaceae bacterium]|jgi:rhodanese-related sulfurtransferase|nr:rhodanese-like domain-containing protein [Paracoccaceae bacterium]MDP7185659.1 rhodanese-like domain-containing protein [Paracoccaceae bacterium]